MNEAELDIVNYLERDYGIKIEQSNDGSYSFKCSYGFNSYSGTGYKTLKDLFDYLNGLFFDVNIALG